MEPVGAGFLAEEAGVPIRTIQFWTDAGVLRPLPESDRQGRGRHRVYPADPYHGERACALIAAEMHRLRLPVGVMRDIMNLIRPQKPPRGAKGVMVPAEEIAHPIRDALAGEPRSVIATVNEHEQLMVAFRTKAIPDLRSGYLLNLTEILRPLREGR